MIGFLHLSREQCTRSGGSLEDQPCGLGPGQGNGLACGRGVGCGSEAGGYGCGALAGWRLILTIRSHPVKDPEACR